MRSVPTGDAALALLAPRVRLFISYGAVAALHILAIVLLASAGGHLLALIPVAAAAYGRGVLHAFDLDHISAIDNSIRKFVAEGRRPVSIGLAFAAGHSTVVLISSVLLVAGWGTIRALLDGASPASDVLGTIGLTVSGTYLLLAACANGPRLAQAVRSVRLRKLGLGVEQKATRSARLLALPLSWVKHPRHAYLLGFAFSLGFDTSAFVGLLIVTAASSAGGAPPVALLAIPLLFTAAITLLDLTNGALMVRLYSSSVDANSRRLAVNVVITALSVFSALFVAASAFTQLLAKADLPGALRVSGVIDIEYGGFVLVAMFLLVVGVAAMVTRRRRQADASPD